jgi:hypothetical protein
LTAAEALQQLVRRYLQFLGPSTVESFVRWAGVDVRDAVTAFESLRPSLVEARTPLGVGQILVDDEQLLRAPIGAAAAARLLPSGDPYYLLWNADRDLLVPDARRRDELWTSRVWPGALLLNGEVAGTWRRAKALVEVTPWRQPSAEERIAVEQEAATLPLPDITATPSVRWAPANA